ncbi:MAG TPA: hypothetical protein VFQ63_02090 [Patescibacteria group bacterium]|nr:hypothetical protein [Patescibacteria group bacterium]
MNMKVAVIVGVVILALLGVSGYFLLSHNATKSLVNPTQSEKPKEASVFNSIQDALTKSLSLKCDYTTGTMHNVAYIKNGQVRSDFSDSKDQSQSGSVIVKVSDKKVYFWNAQKMGFVFAMPDISKITPGATSAGSPSGSQNSAQNMVGDLEQYKKYCQSATVDDSLFVVPTDVKFTDQSEMMKAFTTGAPAGGSPGSNAQNYQQYLQQYQK